MENGELRKQTREQRERNASNSSFHIAPGGPRITRLSTSVQDQYRGDGIVSRTSGYGLHGIRVDGNDLWAVYNATKAARDICLQEGRPCLIEAMTYRIGHHSTSDDSTRYRSINEIKHWQDSDDPLLRFRRYMEQRGWWDAEAENRARDEERMAVLRALERAEGKPKPELGELFTDVYAHKPMHLIEQEAELHAHMDKYPHLYKLDGKPH